MILEETELLLRYVVDLAIILFEFVGVFVILIAGARDVWDYIRHNLQTCLNLATDMALGLEFKLDSEIPRTAVTRELAEIATAAATIALWAVLTSLIHWEIKVEEVDEEMQHHHEILEKA